MSQFLDANEFSNSYSSNSDDRDPPPANEPVDGSTDILLMPSPDVIEDDANILIGVYHHDISPPSDDEDKSQRDTLAQSTQDIARKNPSQQQQQQQHQQQQNIIHSSKLSADILQYRQGVEDSKVCITTPSGNDQTTKIGTCFKCQSTMNNCSCLKAKVTDKQIITYLRKSISFTVNILRVRNTSDVECYLQIILDTINQTKSSRIMISPGSYIIYPTVQSVVCIDGYLATDEKAERPFWNNRLIHVYHDKLTTLTILPRHVMMIMMMMMTMEDGKQNDDMSGRKRDDSIEDERQSRAII